MKDFIPQQQALELKELGFNEDCSGLFYKFEDISEPDKENPLSAFLTPSCVLMPTDGDLFIYGITFSNSTQPISKPTKDYVCLAPTYQQAFRWIREKFGYYPQITNHALYGHYIPQYASLDGEFTGESVLNSKVDGKACVESYEEAELLCLKKLIELAKSKAGQN